jgi:hypothetical protein
MAWTKESKLTPLIDASLGALTTWEGTAFNWDALTTAYWRRIWGKDTKPSSLWTKEA